eukprot:MONOS_853.1-p1 / transcript=MONOS_853.1 / gene=MONOS_853 / organism=Monocercomonoides_exilis_PA203 / gene_product= p97F / transcript_product= p97F / location=Mono_scaffold00014:89339-92199(+) / protein_length=601 / sequence_SO=supercontig / SO=protein_coding / is_pseudo=false
MSKNEGGTTSSLAKGGHLTKVETSYMRRETGFVAMKMGNEIKAAEEERTQERKRNLLVLIIGYLNDQGYIETAEKLQSECSCPFSKFRVADNVDLLNEYEDYYEFRFSKKAKLVRKIDGSGEVSAPIPMRANSASRRSSMRPLIHPQQPSTPSGAQRASSETSSARGKSTPSKSTSPNTQKDSSSSSSSPQSSGIELISVTGTGLSKQQSQSSHSSSNSQLQKRPYMEGGPDQSGSDYFDTRLLRPLALYSDNSELKELAKQIQSEIYMENPGVHWNDIIGLQDAKRLLKEAVVMPIKYPQLFTGLLSPWKGILLYGPPGTGKTMLAKAVATECKTTFFNIKASSIVSKWRGDSEKLVRVLFDLARFHAPSTIFIDELDAILSQRGGSGGPGGSGEHEGSRRMKTELLIQMDGLDSIVSSGSSSPTPSSSSSSSSSSPSHMSLSSTIRADPVQSKHVFVLAASNLPWDLDSAILRRLEKRILVNLPDSETRQSLFQQHLPPERCDETLEYSTYAAQTEGYSGADIVSVCREAAMWPVRRLMDQLETLELDKSKTQEEIESEVHIDRVCRADVNRALKSTRPTGQAFLDKYKTWQEEFGAT